MAKVDGIDWDSLPWCKELSFDEAGSYLGYMASWWNCTPTTDDQRAEFEAAVNWQRGAWSTLAPGEEVVT